MLPEETLEQVRAKQTRWLQLHFPDLYGNLKTKSISATRASSLMFTSGIYSQEISAVFKELYEEPLTLVADPETYGSVAWSEATDRFICNIKSGRERYLKDVRYPLQRVSEAISKAVGAPLTVKESVSFYLTDGASIENRESRNAADVPTKEAPDNLVALKSSEQLSFSSEPKDSYAPVRQQISEVMSNFFNFAVTSHHHGDSNNSQQVLHFDELSPIASADAISTLRMASRAIALVNVAGTTFMPLPYAGSSPSNLDLSVAAFSKGANVFYSEEDENGLSSIGYAFVGGILEHINSLAFFLNPTVNSYKRLAILQKFSAASLNDPHSVVSVQNTPDQFNIHIRVADPLANPYFALASLLAAGLDGINKKASAEILSESPLIMSENQRRRHRVKPLPATLEEALESLQSDNDFLKGVFSPDLIYAYSELKVNEIKEDRQTPSLFDYQSYFHL